MMARHKDKLIQTFKILFAVGLIYWLWNSGKLDFSSLKYFLVPQWAFLGLSLLGINLLIGSERWRLLLKTQDRPTTSFSAFKLSMIGMFFNYAMPGGVGGDVVKAYYFHKDHTNSKVISVTSVLMDRILGLYAMLLMGMIVMVYDHDHVATIPQLQSLFYVVTVVTAVASLGLFLVFSGQVHRTGNLQKLIQKLPMAERLQRLYDSFYQYGRSPADLIKVILLSWAGQVVSIFFLILAGTLSGATAPWATYFLVAPLGFIAIGLPLTPAGVGIGQAAFYVLFNLYLGSESTLGPTIITAFQVGQLAWGLGGAVIYLRRRQPLKAADYAEIQTTQS